MGLPFNPCFFFLLFPLTLLLCFAHGEDELPSNCTKGFLCGSMGYLEFPFAQHTHPHCGLMAVDCDAKPLPNIQLETGGDWYQLQLVKPPVWGDYVIFLGDLKLQRLLESGKYSNLNYTLLFPNSPTIITIQNLEAEEFNDFSKCNYTQPTYDIVNYESYNCTNGFSLKYKSELVPENNPKCDTAAANCTLYPTPILLQQTNAQLTAQFGLYLHVSPSCYDCYHCGGFQFTAGNNNKSQCTKGRVSSPAKKLYLAKRKTNLRHDFSKPCVRLTSRRSVNLVATFCRELWIPVGQRSVASSSKDHGRNGVSKLALQLCVESMQHKTVDLFKSVPL
nr:LEAF RUST 10 DISEASE-RESISTANCE LOCUS RECEPTOR-LIKE PROTEIN KINASE-like 1.1 [Ipomoea batatas]